MTAERKETGEYSRKQARERSGDREENAALRPDRRLGRLARELKATRDERAPLQIQERRGTQLGLAVRLATELVAGFVVGAVIGWYLDKWLGTAPWFLLIFFGLGSVAGVMNVVRTAAILQETVNGRETAKEQAKEQETAPEDTGRRDPGRDGD